MMMPIAECRYEPAAYVVSFPLLLRARDAARVAAMLASEGLLRFKCRISLFSQGGASRRLRGLFI